MRPSVVKQNVVLVVCLLMLNMIGFVHAFSPSLRLSIFQRLNPSSVTSTIASRARSSLPLNNVVEHSKYRSTFTQKAASDEESGPLVRKSTLLKSQKEDEMYDFSGEMQFDVNTAIALVAGQSVIALVAAVLAYFVHTPGLGLGSGFVVNSVDAWKFGILATVPLGVLAVVLDGFEESVPALKRVTKATQRSVLTLLGARFLPLTGLLTATALGIAAGVGEEWLFRGVLQTELVQRIFTDGNVAPAVVLSSIIFGALHAVTPLYAILATLASLYFGFLYVWFDNLAVAMICHAVYDIGALFYAHYTVAKDLTAEERKNLLEMPL